MEFDLLSTEYQVKRIEEEDIPEVYALCKSNPQYYQYCPPFVTVDGIKKDLAALPKGKTPEEKFYLGYYEGGSLVAVMDLITGYPDAKTVWIGIFMVDQHWQGKGVGTAIITEACHNFKEAGFSAVGLGYAKGNPQPEAFWIRNRFEKTGVEVQAEGYVTVVMQRNL